MIVFGNVSVHYAGGVEALSQVNLSIARGEFVFVVGSSGSGKSTLLKLLYRDMLPTEGKVHVNDLDVTLLDRKQIPLLRRRLGVVFQDYRLLPYKSAVENVSYALQVIGAEPRGLYRKAIDALDKVHLKERAAARPDELSGGEQQRVSIARALVNDPLVLLADEPTGNLDPDSSFEVMKILEAINAEGTTVVVATHDREMVDRLAKRVIELSHGRVTRDESAGGYGLPAAAATRAVPETQTGDQGEVAPESAADEARTGVPLATD
jgi:cell division transport system ATP-binding protein